MIRLVVCDIDNTLVPKHKQPSENTLRCIREFHSRGILFGLASGRGTSQLKVLSEKWGITCDILIGMNGGEYEDLLTGEYDILPKLTKDDLKEIFRIMEPFKEVTNVSLLVNGIHYVRRIDEQILASYRYAGKKELPTVATDESIFYSQDAYKVGFRMKAETMPKVEEWVKKHPSDRFKSVKTEFTMYEFGHKMADKGKLLQRFAKAHDISIDDVVGFGDMTNDLTLIKDAGIGVCMENGSIDAKEIADIITEYSIEEDGWSHFVKAHILDEKQDIYSLKKCR